MWPIMYYLQNSTNFTHRMELSSLKLIRGINARRCFIETNNWTRSVLTDLGTVTGRRKNLSEGKICRRSSYYWCDNKDPSWKWEDPWISTCETSLKARLESCLSSSLCLFEFLRDRIGLVRPRHGRCKLRSFFLLSYVSFLFFSPASTGFVLPYRRSEQLSARIGPALAEYDWPIESVIKIGSQCERRWHTRSGGLSRRIWYVVIASLRFRDSAFNARWARSV